ncbi:MAG: hypothetical protein MZV65_14965, partial [Chromatiales bacterium]|nr:hypothetical protein [Chromatiales bacterium]
EVTYWLRLNRRLQTESEKTADKEEQPKGLRHVSALLGGAAIVNFGGNVVGAPDSSNEVIVMTDVHGVARTVMTYLGQPGGPAVHGGG